MVSFIRRVSTDGRYSDLPASFDFENLLAGFARAYVAAYPELPMSVQFVALLDRQRVAYEEAVSRGEAEPVEFCIVLVREPLIDAEGHSEGCLGIEVSPGGRERGEIYRMSRGESMEIL